MKVILTDDVEPIGRRGEVKEVKEGYARNYLLPKKLAIEATSSNLKFWQQQSRVLEKKELKLKESASELASRLEGAKVTIRVKAGEEGKLFGSVTSQNISDALSDMGFQISRKQIELESPLKHIGTYEVTIALHKHIKTKITVEVTPEE
jgi:large subunit ribosomal protein L9